MHSLRANEEWEGWLGCDSNKWNFSIFLPSSRPLFHAHTLLQVATQYYRKRIGGKNIEWKREAGKSFVCEKTASFEKQEMERMENIISKTFFQKNITVREGGNLHIFLFIPFHIFFFSSVLLVVGIKVLFFFAYKKFPLFIALNFFSFTFPHFKN